MSSEDSSHPNQSCVDVTEELLKHYDDKTNLVAVRVLFGFLYVSIFLIGLAGNGGVIWTVARDKKLRSARNIFLLNLMGADLLLCLTSLPVTPISLMLKEWVFGRALCQLIPLSQSMSVLITSWTLAAISLDKFLHIRYATMAAVSLKQALLIMTGIWILACSVNVPLTLSYELLDGSTYVSNHSFELPYCGSFCDEKWHSESHKKAYGTSILFISFLIPLAIICFCYTRILVIVHRDLIVDHHKFKHSLSGTQRKEAQRKKRRVDYILIAMVVCFIAAWCPLTLFNVFRDFGSLPTFVNKQPWLCALIVHSVAMTTAVWNPLLFFWLTSQSKGTGGEDFRIAPALRQQASTFWSKFSKQTTRTDLGTEIGPNVQNNATKPTSEIPNRWRFSLPDNGFFPSPRQNRLNRDNKPVPGRKMTVQIQREAAPLLSSTNRSVSNESQIPNLNVAKISLGRSLDTTLECVELETLDPLHIEERSSYKNSTMEMMS